MTGSGEVPSTETVSLASDHEPEGVFNVVLAGEVDVARQSELRSIVLAFRAEPGSNVRVDLSGVTFMDSTALGLLSQLPT